MQIPRKSWLLVCLLQAGPACMMTVMADVPPTATTTASVAESDRSFLRDATSDSATQIKLGKIALKNSSDAAVGKLAQMLVDDHHAADKKLQALAAKLQIKLPTTASSGDEQDNAKLKDLQGHDFDKAWSRKVIDTHRKAIKMFKHEASSTSSPELKAFAEDRAPVLKRELDMARQLRFPDARNKAMDNTMDMMKNRSFGDRPAGAATSSTVPPAASVSAAPSDNMPASAGSIHPEP